MTKAAFTNEIKRMINEAKNKGEVYIDIKAGDLHHSVGGYPAKPGEHHSMPLCCQAMYSLKREEDEVLYAPPKGKGSKLTIRYYL